jgi:hypothetical protein
MEKGLEEEKTVGFEKEELVSQKVIILPNYTS